MNTQLIDESSGVKEISLSALHQRRLVGSKPGEDRGEVPPKVRFVDAVITTAIFACLAAYLICGAIILFHHLY